MGASMPKRREKAGFFSSYGGGIEGNRLLKGTDSRRFRDFCEREGC